MSSRAENLLFVKTPTILLRIPEYVRLFKCNGVGVCYEFLLAHINRVERSRMSAKYANYDSYVNKLGELYETNNLLAAFFTDEQLAEDMMCHIKTVQSYRSLLTELKLIKTTPYKNGFIYILGERVYADSEKSERTMGTDREAFYIDIWFSIAIADKKNKTNKLAEYLLDKLGNERCREHIRKKEERLSQMKKRDARVTKHLIESDIDNISSEQLEQEREVQADFFAAGNYFHENEKLVSPEEPVETPEEPAPSGQIFQLFEEPIEDKDLKIPVKAPEVVTSAPEPNILYSKTPYGIEDISGDKIFNVTGRNKYNRSGATDSSEAFRSMMESSCDNPRALIKLMRKFIAAGAPKSEVEEIALGRYGYVKRFKHYPRFAIELKYQSVSGDRTTQHTRIYHLLNALREDISGAAPSEQSSQEALTTKHLIRKMLEDYKFEQIEFTIRHMAEHDKGDLAFFVQVDSFKSLPHFLKKHSQLYQSRQSERLRLENERVLSEIRTQESEKNASELSRKAAETLANMTPEQLAEKENRLRLIRERRDARNAKLK